MSLTVYPYRKMGFLFLSLMLAAGGGLLVFHGYIRHDGAYRWLPLELLLAWILSMMGGLSWVSERYTVSNEGVEHAGLWGGTHLDWTKVLFWEYIPQEKGKEIIAIFGEGKRLVVRGAFGDYPKLKQALEARLSLVDRSHPQAKKDGHEEKRLHRPFHFGLIRWLGNLRIWIARLFLYQYWIGLGVLGVYALLAKRVRILNYFAPVAGLLILNLYVVLWAVWSLGRQLLNRYLDTLLQAIYLEGGCELPLVIEILQKGGYWDEVTVVEAFWVLAERLQREQVALSEAQRETVYAGLLWVQFSELLVERILDWVVREQDRLALPYLEELRTEKALNERTLQKLDQCSRLLSNEVS